MKIKVQKDINATDKHWKVEICNKNVNVNQQEKQKKHWQRAEKHYDSQQTIYLWKPNKKRVINKLLSRFNVAIQLNNKFFLLLNEHKLKRTDKRTHAHKRIYYKIAQTHIASYLDTFCSVLCAKASNTATAHIFIRKIISINWKVLGLYLCSKSFLSLFFSQIQIH